MATLHAKWNRRVLAQRGVSLVWAVFRTVLIVGLAFIIIQPLLIKLASSFKGTADLYDSSVFLIPKHFTLDNYKKVWDYLEYPLRFFNSVLYSCVCAFLQMVSCALVAYGIARFRFRGRNLIFGAALFTLIIPPQCVLISSFLQFKAFGPLTFLTLGTQMQGIDLVGTPIPLLLLSLTAVGFKNGLYIFMLRQYFKNLPKELEEAAAIDGCNRLKTFYTIMLPGAIPMFGAIFLFAFVWQWNDYFYTTVLTPGLKVFTTVLPTLGKSIQASSFINYGSMQALLYDAAGLILHIVPLLLLYVFTQKVFVQSVERSGMVG